MGSKGMGNLLHTADFPIQQSHHLTCSIVLTVLTSPILSDLKRPVRAKQVAHQAPI